MFGCKSKPNSERIGHNKSWKHKILCTTWTLWYWPNSWVIVYYEEHRKQASDSLNFQSKYYWQKTTLNVRDASQYRQRILKWMEISWFFKYLPILLCTEPSVENFLKSRHFLNTGISAMVNVWTNTEHMRSLAWRNSITLMTHCYKVLLNTKYYHDDANASFSSWYW